MSIEEPAFEGGAVDAGSGVTAILRRTQPWVRFLSIMGFASAGLLIVGGVVAGAVGLARGNIELAALLVVYPLIGVLYLFPSLYLLRYSNGIREFVEQAQQSQLEAALDAQRAFWKFAGVLTVVYLCLLVVGLAVAVIVGIIVWVAAR